MSIGRKRKKDRETGITIVIKTREKNKVTFTGRGQYYLYQQDEHVVR